MGLAKYPGNLAHSHSVAKPLLAPKLQSGHLVSVTDLKQLVQQLNLCADLRQVRTSAVTTLVGSANMLDQLLDVIKIICVQELQHSFENLSLAVFYDNLLADGFLHSARVQLTCKHFRTGQKDLRMGPNCFALHNEGHICTLASVKELPEVLAQ
eukprot:Skav229648  [mRNA]  locus=scaffold649:368721:371117:+ [translate_table: standard]